TAFGSTIDWWMNAELLPLSTLERSGPTVPVAPAGVKVWHEAQPFAAKTCFPAAALPLLGAGGEGDVEVDVVGCSALEPLASGSLSRPKITTALIMPRNSKAVAPRNTPRRRPGNSGRQRGIKSAEMSANEM